MCGVVVRVVLVTGTSTAVGKTIATAALAACSRRLRRTVAVVKPVQTGVNIDEPSDMATVERLTGIAGFELVRLDDPLAPDTAARLRGTEIPTVAELGARVAAAAGSADVVYVEGAGGILVRLDTEGGTLLSLGQQLAASGHEVEVVVVTSLALGTLNHTELTVRAVQAAGLTAAGLVLGDVPASSGLAERVNVEELPRVTGLPVIAAIPRGVGDWSSSEFVAACEDWVYRSF